MWKKGSCLLWVYMLQELTELSGPLSLRKQPLCFLWSGKICFGGRSGFKKQNTWKGTMFPLSSHQRAFPLEFSNFNLSHCCLWEAEVRNDPASTAGGNMDLLRMQLRLWHHISTLKTVLCRQPLITSHRDTNVNEREQTMKRWEQSLLGFPEFSSIWAWTRWGFAPSLGTRGWMKPAHGTRHQACNPQQLPIEDLWNWWEPRSHQLMKQLMLWLCRWGSWGPEKWGVWHKVTISGKIVQNSHPCPGHWLTGQIFSCPWNSQDPFLLAKWSRTQSQGPFLASV
jgi:hypothetical protein